MTHIYSETTPNSFEDARNNELEISLRNACVKDSSMLKTYDDSTWLHRNPFGLYGRTETEAAYAKSGKVGTRIYFKLL